MEQIPDDRVRYLCRGLTRYDLANRWGATEVREWLEGREHHAGVASESGAGTRFGDAAFNTPEDFAQGLASEWDLSAEMLSFAYPRRRFMEEVMEAFPSKRLDALWSKWRMSSPVQEQVDHSVVGLIVALHPDAEPSCGRSGG